MRTGILFGNIWRDDCLSAVLPGYPAALLQSVSASPQRIFRKHQKNADALQHIVPPEKIRFFFF